ncbi:MAG: hypothetical protein WC789_03670 [Lentisphaeria bacterium]|jgi:hypothetical protein
MKTIIPAILSLFLIAGMPAWAQLPPVQAPSASTKPSSQFEVVRFKENPIIHAGMKGLFRSQFGNNICQPSILCVPAWVEHPLGKYYLYFGDHHGTYVQMAYADHLEGPWIIYEPGTLQLKETPGLSHLGGTNMFVDDAAKEIRMYFYTDGRHFPAFLNEKPDWRCGLFRNFVALSKDGIHFTCQPVPLGHFFMRVFQHGGFFYGLSLIPDSGFRPGELNCIVSRSKDGLTPFESGPRMLPDCRHCALWVEGNTLYVVYTRFGEAPERIQVSTVDLSPDWTAWKASPPEILLEPEKDYEGVKLPLVPSTPGAVGPVRQLRDPAIYEENGKRYLLYAVEGEQGIAIAELKSKGK